MSRNIGLVAALALMPVIGVVILPLCAVAVGMSAACCGDCCGFKHLLADGAFLMLCAVGGFGSCRVNDPLAGAVSRNIGLIAALALVPVVGVVILPLCTVAVGMSAACCGDLHQELDGAVGIFLRQVHDLAVYIQLHIVGEGHALLRLQIDSGRILLTGDKRCGCVAPKYIGRFNLIRIAAGHGDTIDRRYLSGHRCDLHRRLRHIVGVFGGLCGEVHIDIAVFARHFYLIDRTVGHGHVLCREALCEGKAILGLEVIKDAVVLLGIEFPVLQRGAGLILIQTHHHLQAIAHLLAGGIACRHKSDGTCSLIDLASGRGIQGDLFDAAVGTFKADKDT